MSLSLSSDAKTPSRTGDDGRPEKGDQSQHMQYGRGFGLLVAWWQIALGKIERLHLRDAARLQDVNGGLLPPTRRAHLRSEAQIAGSSWLVRIILFCLHVWRKGRATGGKRELLSFSGSRVSAYRRLRRLLRRTSTSGGWRLRETCRPRFAGKGRRGEGEGDPQGGW
ncbi:hypothetical protein EJ06DRAFT_86580 [Trichodelitschia bisporula]|uniref:Uncharacterized protein n=1 Tax=Trichodelitschia bisporula TaxID=703511 RepID=A0A6G1HRK4_9PEZI|nr:hypothetical protein EJ06DRAFT_86580 [Trichodelitschia bisporula]